MVAVQAYRSLSSRRADEELHRRIGQPDQLDRPQPRILAQGQDLLLAWLVECEEASGRVVENRCRLFGKNADEFGQDRRGRVAQDVTMVVRQPRDIVFEPVPAAGDIPDGARAGFMRQLGDQDRREAGVEKNRAPARQIADAGAAAKHDRGLVEQEGERGRPVDFPHWVVVQECVRLRHDA